jgi:hypothetical protein
MKQNKEKKDEDDADKGSKDKDKKDDKDKDADADFEKQLKQLEKPLKHKQVHILFKIVDIDNDKNITFKEFLRLIRF